MKIRIAYYPLLVLASVMWSCYSYTEPILDDKSSTSLALECTLRAATPVEVETRSTNDDTVNFFDLLIFDKDDIFTRHIHIPAKQISHDASSYRFSVRVVDIQGAKRTIHILANYDLNKFPDTLCEGKNAGELLPSMLDTSIDPDRSPVMWGMYSFENGFASTNRLSTTLLRNVAECCVTLSDDVVSRGLFLMEEVSIINAATNGTVAPFPFTSVGARTQATEPTTMELHTITRHAEQGTTSLGQYMFERRVRTHVPALDPSQFVSVVVKGSYDSNPSSYYRVLVGQRLDDGTFSPYEILRNSRYTIRIQEISGNGYPTLEQALRYEPANNIDYSIQASFEEQISDITGNGQYMLGLSRKDMYLYSHPVDEVSADWELVTKIYLDPIVASSIHDHPTPSIEELQISLPDDTDGVIADWRWIVSDQLDALGYPVAYLHAKFNRCEDKVKNASFLIRAGNLSRSIDIRQSRNNDFRIADTIYVSWRPNMTIDLPIRTVIDPIEDVKCQVSIRHADVEYLELLNEAVTISAGVSAQTPVLQLKTAKGFYCRVRDQVYRSQKVVISAPGYNDKVVTIKQSRFFEGIFDTGIIGIYRHDEDTQIHTMAFADVESAWTAEVVQGDEDLIYLGQAHDNDVNYRRIEGQRMMTFKYRLGRNTSSADRYGRIRLTYGNGQCEHIIYVHQGFRDVEFNGIDWPARNIEGSTGSWAAAPDSPGSMYKYGSRTMNYSSTTPSWGLTLSDWSSTGGSPSWAESNNPCPSGYSVPHISHYNYSIGIEKVEFYTNYLTSLASISADNRIITHSTPVTHIMWGKINDNPSRDTRSGIMLLTLDDSGNLVRMFFLPATGVRSQSFALAPNMNHTNPLYVQYGGWAGGGKLLYNHLESIDNPAQNYGNQGGGYWFRSSGTSRGLDLYHDVDDIIGLTTTWGSKFGIQDACPVRCVKADWNDTLTE